MLIDSTKIKQAYDCVQLYLHKTPLFRSQYYSNLLNADIYLKLEIMQPTHSFKVRGAFNAISSLNEEQRKRGVITASGGNHGLGVAYAAATLGVKASVYLPKNTPVIKINAIKALHAEVILYGDVFDEAAHRAISEATQKNCTFIHPFNNEKVMAGQGTIAMELLEQCPEMDWVITSIGGGGLISGITSALQAHSPRTRIAGVETEGADCMSKSLQAHKIIELAAITSVAESLGAKRTEQIQFDIVSKYVNPVTVVTDEEAIHALLDTLEYEKIMIEPAASCTLAALAAHKIPIKEREKVVVVMCGANISRERICEWGRTYKS
jgi:threonine dehydratase